MGTPRDDAAGRPGLFRRIWNQIKALIFEQSELNERRRTLQARSGQYGTGGTGDAPRNHGV